MKTITAILGMILSIVSAYLMFTSKSTLDLVCGFAVLLMAIIFILFSIMEEQKQDIEYLRHQLWFKLK